MSSQNGRVSDEQGHAGRPPGRKLPVRNPYTGEVDYEITPPTPQELTGLCDSLRAAQVKWGAAPLEHRVEVMLRWADELEAAYGPLSAADFTDTGGCLIALMSPRIVASSVRSWAADAAGVLGAAARSGTSSIMPSITFRTQLVPYPLVGVISPWNGPLMLSCLDPVPALFAGSAVMVKPSEVAPRFVAPLMDTIRGDISASRPPPVSVKSAADSFPYAASSSSAQRSMTSTRCSSGAAAHFTCAARSESHSSVSSCSAGGVIW